MAQPQKPQELPTVETNPLSEGEGSSSDPIDEKPTPTVTEVLSNIAQSLSPRTTQTPQPQPRNQPINPTTPLQQALQTGQVPVSVRPKQGLQQQTLGSLTQLEGGRQIQLPTTSLPPAPEAQAQAQAGQGGASSLSLTERPTREQGQGLGATEQLFGPQPQDPTTRYLLLEGALREMEVREEERQREYQERRERERQKYQRLNDAFEQARIETNRPSRRLLFNIEEEEDTEDELLVDATRGLVTRHRRKKEAKSPSPRQTSPSHVSPSRIVITQDRSPGRERTTRTALPDSQTQPEEEVETTAQ